MNVWTDAVGFFGPYLWGVILGGIIGGLVCGLPGLLICRLLAKRQAITLYYENKAIEWCFSGGAVLGVLAGLYLAWAG
jgi:hypothetical protein